LKSEEEEDFLGGEMTQTLYAHINKRKKILRKIKKKEEDCFHGRQRNWREFFF
jgi:hypothetical protein